MVPLWFSELLLSRFSHRSIDTKRRSSSDDAPKSQVVPELVEDYLLLRGSVRTDSDELKPWDSGVHRNLGQGSWYKGRVL